MPTEELQLIEWLQGQPQPAAGVLLGLGDDMAVVELGTDSLLVASDMLVGGTHFDPAGAALEQVGHKALAACLSDCAAMAVRPRYATVSMALPRGRVLDMGRPILEGMLETARRFECPIVGGDTTSGTGALVIDVTVAATPWPGTRPVTRSGGQPGDLLCVSGTLGGSLTGHHLCFQPRVAEARALQSTVGPSLHALLDISDGLALDTARLARASSCGAVLSAAALDSVTSPAARRLATPERSARDHVLGDGEDFELLAAIDPAGLTLVRTLAWTWHVVGQLCDAGLWLDAEDGTRHALTPVGYVH